jgi:hypothetical protein
MTFRVAALLLLAAQPVSADVLRTVYGCARGVEIAAFYFEIDGIRQAILDLPQGATLFELSSEAGDGAVWVEPGGYPWGLIWRTKGYFAALSHVALVDWRTGKVDPERLLIGDCGELG